MYSSYGSYNSGGATAVAIITLLIGIGLSVLMIISQWKLFQKAGEPGWKSIIPFYGGYMAYKLTWSPAPYFVTLAVSIASQFVTRVPALVIILAIVTLVLGIVALVNTAHAYGKYGGFAAGMVFLPFVFYPILAFGDSQYVGPCGEPVYHPYGSSEAAPAPDESEAPGEASAPAQAPVPASNGPVWIAAAVLGGIALLVIGYRLWLSMCNYNAVRGAAFIGLENFNRMFQTGILAPAIGPTLATRFVDLLLAVGLGFAGAAAGRSRARSAIAGLGALLAIIPLSVWESVFFVNRMISMQGGAIAYFLHALPWAGLSMFAGALLAPRWRSTAGAALVAPALMLLSGVSSVGASPILAVRNLDYMVLNFGVMRMEIGPGAAVEVVRGLITLPLAVGGLFLLMALLRGHAGEDGTQPQGGALPATLLAGLIPLGLGLLLIAAGNHELFADPSYASSLGTSIGECFLTLALGFGLYFGLYSLVGRFDPKRSLPLGLAMLLGLALGALSNVGTLWARALGILNTVIPVVINGVLDPLSLTFAFVLALYRPRKPASRVFLALAAAAFAAGRCATAGVGSYLYSYRNTDLGLWFRSSMQRYYGHSSALSFMVGNLLAMCGIPAALTGLFSMLGSQDR